MNEEGEIYSKIINIDEEKNTQIRLTINEFRGTEYLHLRRYYLDFDEEWKPSSEGISLALDISNTRNLFEGMAEILSLAESKEIIVQEFGDLIKYLYEK